MTRTKIIAATVCTLVAALLAGGYLLFHGYFDTGTFEIKNAQWSSPKQVAVVGKRSDREATNGDQYFVLIGDHLFSPRELRHAYYGHDVIFRANSDCLTLRWIDPHNIVVTCVDHSIEPGAIAVQQHRSGEVAISYINIPNI